LGAKVRVNGEPTVTMELPVRTLLWGKRKKNGFSFLKTGDKDDGNMEIIWEI